MSFNMMMNNSWNHMSKTNCLEITCCVTVRGDVLYNCFILLVI